MNSVGRSCFVRWPRETRGVHKNLSSSKITDSFSRSTKNGNPLLNALFPYLYAKTLPPFFIIISEILFLPLFLFRRREHRRLVFRFLRAASSPVIGLWEPFVRFHFPPSLRFKNGIFPQYQRNLQLFRTKQNRVPRFDYETYSNHVHII